MSRNIKFRVEKTYSRHDLDFLVRPTERSHIINRNPTILLEQRAIQHPIRHLRDTFKRSILRRLEVYRRRPVVAEILGQFAGCAFCCLGWIEVCRIHL